MNKIYLQLVLRIQAMSARRQRTRAAFTATTAWESEQIELKHVRSTLKLSQKRQRELRQFLHRCFSDLFVEPEDVDIDGEMYYLTNASNEDELVAVLLLDRHWKVGADQPEALRRLNGSTLLFNVCTAEEHRGHGHMKALMQHVLARLQEDDSATDDRQPVVLMVSQTNVPALTLYRKFGFQVIGQQKVKNTTVLFMALNPSETRL